MHTRSVAMLYLFLKGVSSLFVAVVYTVELIYQAQRVGLNPFQLVLAGLLLLPALFLYARTIHKKLPIISASTQEAEDPTVSP